VLTTTFTTPDTSIGIQGVVSRHYRLAPGITQSILDNGVVLSYLSQGTPPSTTGIFPLPYLFPHPSGPNQTLQFSYLPVIGKICYYVSNLTTGINNTVGITADTRYVIIPGGVAGGRGVNSEKIVDIKGQTYTESQLKNMSYQQVCSLLNIPQ
jgi:hypothetical protein